MNMDIRKNRVITLHYTIRDQNDTLLETTVGKIPLSFIYGRNQILNGIETALKGKKTGDTLELTIPKDKAYGERDDSLTSILPASALQGVEEIKPGMHFEMPHDEGVHVATVIEVKGREVIIDNNHPLAGKDLHVHVEILDIRDMTPEERETGQARQMFEFIDE
jgi:FKBP-type peptidyl-prolyl cis-trans isomerase SlyD